MELGQINIKWLTAPKHPRNQQKCPNYYEYYDGSELYK